MRLYRLVRRKHSAVLSGKGAAVYGARWNSAGTEIIYTASSRALAMAEVAVHLSLSDLAGDFQMLEIEVPDSSSVETLNSDELPMEWNLYPHSRSTQHFGDRFVREGKHLLLQVPSVVVKGDYNLLINPQHPDFAKVEIATQDDFPFDRRFFRG